ncbi:MAG: cytochrome c peroxidase, partial [Bacteroidota bacterium]
MYFKFFKAFISFVLLLVLILCCKDQNQPKPELTAEVSWEYAQNFYLQNINEAIGHLDSLAYVPAESDSARMLFKKARTAFKKAEPYASYLNPEVGHRANGPALPVFLDDTERVMNPIGLQKLEEGIYDGGVEPEVFTREALLTKGLLINLQNNIKNRKLNPQRFFIATHQQLLRIISLSISGFDTPVSYQGFQEAMISLGSLKDIYQNTIAGIIEEKDPVLDQDFLKNVDAAMAYLKDNQDFETFDRYTFIRDFMNPITRNWVAIRKTSGLWEGVNNKPFNFDAPTFFEKDAFNLVYFTPVINRNVTKEQIRLGEKLFFDPNLSADGKMACASCHIPEKAYADGLIANQDNQGRPLERNTPTLINAAFQKSFFWDGRSETLLDQISSVFTNEKEFNSNVHQFSDAILKDSSY